MPKKKNSVSLKQKIYKQLRHDIVFGRILPGEHLKEARLTDTFQCSRGPVREAFSQLDSEGFLVLLQNQGAVVSKTSPEEIADFYAMLELLEAQAVEWATPRLKAADIEILEKINADIKRISCEDNGSIEPWSSANLEFHRLFRKKCGNGQIDRIIEDIRMRITRYRHMSLLVTAYDEYVLDHEKIIETVRLGYAKEAGGLMKIHIRRAKDVLMEFLSKFPGF
ncbi:MAG: GntR family transcriptional regulator [Desulfosarcina sp.]